MIDDLNILEDEDRLKLAAKLVGTLDIPSVTEEDAYNLMSKMTLHTELQIEKGLYAMAYIRLRDFENYSRVDAYKKVWPTRWKATDSRKTVEARARRIEFTDIYKKIMVETQLNFYSIFAIERIKAVNDTLRRAYDRNVSEKYNFEYMKLFIESTKQPEGIKVEHEFNMTADGVSIKDVEHKLTEIANKLDGVSGADIMDAVLIGESDGN